MFRSIVRVSAAVLAVLAGAAPAAAAAAPTIEYQGAFSFLAPGETADLGKMRAVVAERSGGGVWASGDVRDAGGKYEYPIRRFSAGGDIEQTIPDPSPPTEFRSIRDLDLSLDGSVIYAPALAVTFDPDVPDRQLGVLRISTATGEVLGAFATPGDDPGDLPYAASVTVAPDGDVYVTGPASVKRYSAGGAFEAEIPLPQSFAGRGLDRPAVDPQTGDILVLDGASFSKPQEFDRYSAAGAYLGTFAGPPVEFGFGLAVRPQDGTIYVPSGGYVFVYRADGSFFGLEKAPTGGLERLSIRPDGTRLWATAYTQNGTEIGTRTLRYFATGEGPEPVLPVVPDTRLDAAPPYDSDDSTPTFAFSSDQPDARFECSLDSAGYQPCTSPLTLGPLPAGWEHFFVVRAVNDAGPDPSPASALFLVRGPSIPGPGGSGGPGGLPGGGTVSLTSGIDRTGPALPFPGSKRARTATRAGVVTLTLGPMTEDTTGVLQLRTNGRVKIGSGRRAVVALGTKSFVAPNGQTVAVRVTLSERNRRLLRRLKKVPALATITLRDSRGNATTRRFVFPLQTP